MPAGMQITRPQPACEPLTGRGPPGQPFPIERPQSPAEQREQRRGRPMPQAPEERRIRPPRGKPADHAGHQGVEVEAEPCASSYEQTVGARSRDKDEAVDREQLLQILATALQGIGGLDLTHPAQHFLVAYPQHRAAQRGRGFEGSEAVHGDVCRRISHLLWSLEGLGAVLDEEQTALPREPGNLAEIHAPSEEVRDQYDPRACREGRLEHQGPRRERLRVDIYRDSPQSVAAYDPDHVRMRDGREENLISGP